MVATSTLPPLARMQRVSLLSHSDILARTMRPGVLDGGQWRVGEVQHLESEKNLEAVLRFAWWCHAAGVPCFIPMSSRRVKRPNRSWETRYTPLLFDYVAFADEAATEWMASVLPDSNPARLLTELRFLDARMRQEPSFGLCPVPTKGSHYRVREGPMEGMEVRVDEVTGSKVVCFLVDGLAARVDDLPLSNLEPV